MDKAVASEARDCEFDSRRVHNSSIANLMISENLFEEQNKLSDMRFAISYSRRVHRDSGGSVV